MLPTSSEGEQWFDGQQYNTLQYMIIHYILYCATAAEGEQWFDGHQVARGQSLGPPGPPTTYKPQPRTIFYKLVIHTEISSKNQIGSNTNAGVFDDIICKLKAGVCSVMLRCLNFSVCSFRCTLI